MIQKSYVLKTEADMLHMINWLNIDLAYLKAKTIFAQIYFSRFDAVEAETIVHVLKKNIPSICIAGMSLYGDPIVNLNSDKFIKINFCFFSSSDVHVFEYDSSKKKLASIITDFKNQLDEIEDVKGVLLLGSGITFKASHFMESVTQNYENIPFFGSISNINTGDVNTIQPYAFGHSFVTNGIVAAVFSGKELSFYTESLFSWKPIGKEMEVTACSQNDGTIGDTLIKTIDGIPATQIYKKYLDVEPDGHFIANICEFPIVVNRNNYLMARVPCGFNKATGELSTMGDIKDGEKIRFTYGKTSEILEKSQESSEKLLEFMPEGVFLYVCANRAIFLKDRAKEEINFYRNINPNLVYCHGFSELYRYKNQGGVFNSQLVVVGLREGEPNIELFAEDFVELAGITFKSNRRSDEPEKNTLTIKDSQNMFQFGLTTPIPLSERLVTFLEATTEELKKMTQAANAASEAKSLFLSNMSHEIRSPINAVLGLDEMIIRESGEDFIRTYAQDIQSSGKTLLSIINDILDFSKIEAGKMEIINADYDLRQTITDLANMIETRAHSKDLDFIVNVDTKMPHLLFGDETRIKQCVLNILTNAIKYTHIGSVTFSVGFTKKDENHIDLTFDIKDTGIGIKEEDLEKLTRPFERIEESRNRSIEGTGLGMSIVNGLLHQMGTELCVKSEYGKGSDFSFSVEQEVRDWEKIGTHDEALVALSKNAASYTESFQAPDARILVVDDTPINLTVAKGLLKNTRIQVDTAESGEEALKMCRKTEYHILFVDHRMPKMDGIEFLAENWADSTSINKNTPAVVLTANAVSGAKEMYIEAGFTDYLSKPIDSRQFEEMIARLLPKELVLHFGDKGFIENERKSAANLSSEITITPRNSTKDTKATTSNEEKNNNASEIFSDLFGINISDALKNCGTKEVFLNAINDFYDAIEEKSSQIEQFANIGDCKNYTVLVHALKSSARLIGANELSEMARELETAGDIEQKDDITNKTPILLKLYRSYTQKLLPLCKNKVTTKNDLRPEITKEKLKEALTAILESAQVFDFDMLDAILSELENFRIEDNFLEYYNQIVAKVRAVDQKSVVDLVKSALKEM